MDGPEDDESDIYGSDEEPLFHSVVSHIAVTRGYSFSRIGRERRLCLSRRGIGSVTFINPLHHLTPLLRGTFSFTANEVSLECHALNGPAVVMVAQPGVHLTGNGLTIWPFAASKWFCLFIVPHFSKYRITSDDEEESNDSEQKQEQMPCRSLAKKEGSEACRLTCSSNESMMFYLQSCAPTTTAYNIPVCLHLRASNGGVLHAECLIQALCQAQLRHPSLCTTYRMTASGLAADVSAVVPAVSQETVLELSPVAKVKHLITSVLTETEASFDISTSVFRMKVFQLCMDEVFVLLHFHHIAVDGTSINILLQDVKQLCLDNVLPGCASRTLVAEEEEERELQKKFGSWVDYTKTLNFSSSFPIISSSKSPEEAGYLCISLGDQAFIGSLRDLCKELHVSLPALTTASLGLALCCVLQTEDLVLGYVSNGRDTPALQTAVGFIANTMPVGIKATSSKHFFNLIQEVHNVFAMIQDSKVSFGALLPHLDVPHSRRSKQLFSFFIIHQEMMQDALHGLVINGVEMESSLWVQDTLHTQTELSVEILPHFGGYNCRWQYSKSRLDEELVAYIHQVMVGILSNALQDTHFLAGSWIRWYQECHSHFLNCPIPSSCTSVVIPPSLAGRPLRTLLPMPNKLLMSISHLSDALGVYPEAVYGAVLLQLLSQHTSESNILVMVLATSPFGCTTTHPVAVEFARNWTVRDLCQSFQSQLLASMQRYVPPLLLPSSYHPPYFAITLDPCISSSVTANEMGTLLQLQPEGIWWSFGNHDGSSVQWLPHCYLQLLTEFTTALPTTVLPFPAMLTSEAHALKVELNDTAHAYNESDSAITIFLHSVQQNETKVALMFEDEMLTYGGLLERVCVAAHFIKQAGVMAEDNVVVFLERSLDLFVYLLAIFYVNATYVPIALQSPANRVAYICSEVNASLLVTQTSLLEVTAGVSRKILCVDALPAEPNSTLSVGTPEPSSGLAYVLFTSGTTGAPKGVCVTNENLVFFINAVKELLTADNLAFTRLGVNVSFDPHLLEFFPTLEAGGCGIVMPDITCTHPAVTFLTYTPSALQVACPNKGLQVAMVGGELLTPSQYSRIRHVPRVINGYGPTECTIMVTVNGDVTMDNTSSIGQPMANTQVFVLDKYLNICPVGVPGILYIAGRGVAKGYLGDLHKTKQAFFENFFGDGSIYCTGDVVCMQSDGSLTFIGRWDNQVKLRGMRFELGEVESALLACSGVSTAIAVIRDIGTSSPLLVGYVTPQSVSSSVVLEELKDVLPEYMVPSHVVAVDQFPLTKEGKCNKQALPLPVIQKAPLSSPANVCSEEDVMVGQMKELFGSVLNMRNISSDDDFFKVGGNSLLSIQLASMVSDQFHVRVTPKEVARCSTPSQLLQHITPFLALESPSRCTPEGSTGVSLKGYHCSPLSSQQWVAYALQKLRFSPLCYTTRLRFTITAKPLALGVVSQAMGATLESMGVSNIAFCELDDEPSMVCMKGDERSHQDQTEGVCGGAVQPCHSVTMTSDGHFFTIDLCLHRVLFNCWDVDFLKSILHRLSSHIDTAIVEYKECKGTASENLHAMATSQQSINRGAGYMPQEIKWSVRCPTFSAELDKLVGFLLLYLWKCAGKEIALHCFQSSSDHRSAVAAEVNQKKVTYELANDNYDGNCTVKSAVRQLRTLDSEVCDALIYYIPPVLACSLCNDSIEIHLQSSLPVFAEYPMSVGIFKGPGFVTFHLAYQSQVHPCTLLCAEDLVDFLTGAVMAMRSNPAMTVKELSRLGSRLVMPVGPLDPIMSCAPMYQVWNILGVHKFVLSHNTSLKRLLKDTTHLSLFTKEMIENAAIVQQSFAHQFNVHVPAQTLLLAPSKESIQVSLAALYFLGQSQEPEPVFLNDGPLQHIFCFPELSGSPLVYQALSKGMSHQFVGLQLHKSSILASNTLPELVSSLVQQIVSVQASGPYFLLGYSFGALLAYEAAVQLTAVGQVVKSLICIDGSPCLVQCLDSAAPHPHLQWVWWDLPLFCCSLFGVEMKPSANVTPSDILQRNHWIPLDSVQLEELYARITRPVVLASSYAAQALPGMSCVLIRAPQHQYFTSHDYGLASLCEVTVKTIPNTDHYDILASIDQAVLFGL